MDGQEKVYGIPKLQTANGTADAVIVNQHGAWLAVRVVPGETPTGPVAVAPSKVPTLAVALRDSKGDCIAAPVNWQDLQPVEVTRSVAAGETIKS